MAGKTPERPSATGQTGETPRGCEPRAKRDARKSRVRELAAGERYAAIRRDLLDQLERSGAVGQYFIDLVEDYMDLWVEKRLLSEDIQKRGVVVTYKNGSQTGRKRNDSIAEKGKVIQTMTGILKTLGIESARDEDDADDEL